MLFAAGHCAIGEEPIPELQGVVVEASRSSAENAPGMISLDAAEFSQRPRQTIDQTLQGVPGFRLFRRTPASTAHPTAQGASLFSGGPNAASRTILLLDGVPQNDPFGGWVPWTAIPGADLQQVSMFRQGGVTESGWRAMDGVVSLATRTENSGVPFGLLEVRSGSALDAELAAYGRGKIGNLSTVFGSARRVSFSGHPVVAADQRGRVDENATHEFEGFSGGWVQQLGTEGNWSLTGRIRSFREQRGNGTPLSTNATEGTDWSISLRRLPTVGPQSEFTFYRQERQFRNVFSAVDESRTSERPVLDQFSVPSNATGGSARVRLDGGNHAIALGADARHVEGATNEAFRNLGSGFTRKRRAGGEQLQAGLFATDTWKPRDDLKITAAGRIDYFARRDGTRAERDTVMNREILDEHFDDVTKWAPTGRISALWDPPASDPLEVEASVFTGTREPTLNELYRPFRVGNDITEANPLLDREKVHGASAGVRWNPEDRAFVFSDTAFYHQLEDSVANVTLVDGPANLAPWGFIPEGGTGRLRLNLDEVHVTGFELAAEGEIAHALRWRAAWLTRDTSVERSGVRPSLEGRALSQTPRHQASASLEFDGGDRLFAGVELRWSDTQFEDDANRIELGSFITADLFAGYRISEKITATVAVENIFDETIETRRTADGLTFIGPPRTFTASVRVEF